MKNIVVAVSGGPDSMALLDMLRRTNKYNCIVAHINYQQRKTADRDEKLVKAYAKKHDLVCLIKKGPKRVDGNFQSFARDFRYRFFKEVAHLYDSKDIYIAHHEDDHIETYLMQKRRNIRPSIYGLAKSYEDDGYWIHRPLLKCTKEELIEYCHEYEVPYEIDESNLETVYLRNKVRKEIVDKMSKSERKEIIEIIERENSSLKEHYQEVESFYQEFLKKEAEISYLLSVEKYRRDILRRWFESYGIYSISNDELVSVIEFLKSEQGSKYLITDFQYIFNDYGYLKIASLHPGFKFIFEENISIGNYEHFSFKKEGDGTEAVTLNKDDFPITVRNFQAGDSIKLRFGTKKVSQWFKDRKISLNERERWPIMLNAHGDVILVPGIGCNIDHYSTNPSVFMVK